MKKSFKIFLAVIGAVEVIFSIFIPISLSLLLVKIYFLTKFQTITVVIAGSLSSLYRALSMGWINK